MQGALNPRFSFIAVLLFAAGFLLSSCAPFVLPEFNDYDAIDPVKTPRSYKFDAVRGLKIILARHTRRAKVNPKHNTAFSTIVLLRNNDECVCRLYLNDDTIGFQLCDPKGADFSQPILEDKMDSEDKRVIGIFLRY